MTDVVLPRPDIWLPDYTKVGEKLKLPKWARPWDTPTIDENFVFAVGVDSAAGVIAVNVGSGGVAPNSPSTGTFTNNNGDLVVCGVGLGTATGVGNQGTIGAVTYAGLTMTLLGSQRVGANSESIAAIYYLINAPKGSNTLSVAHSWTGTSASYNVSAGCTSFTGAGIPIDFVSTSSGGVTSLSQATLNIVEVGNMSFAVLGNGSGSGFSQNQTASWVAQDQSSTQLGSFHGAYASGAGAAITHQESWTGADSAIVAVIEIPIAPAGLGRRGGVRRRRGVFSPTSFRRRPVYAGEFNASVPIEVQAVPAHADFSAVSTAAIQPQAVPATTNFSAGTNNAAIEPKIPSAANVNYSALATGAEALQSVPATVNFSAISTAAFVPSVTAARTDFSAISTLAEATTAVVGTCNFSALASVAVVVPEGTAALVTFSGIASTNLPIVNQIVSAGLVNYSMLVTVAESLQEPPATCNFSSAVNKVAIAPQAPNATVNFSSLVTAAIAPQAPNATTTFSAGPVEKVVIAPQVTAARTDFSAIATVVESLTSPAARVNYSTGITKVEEAAKSNSATVTFSVAAGVDVVWTRGDVVGYLTLREVDSSSVTLREFSRDNMTIREFERDQMTLRTVE